MIKTALILAAGLGSRLGDRTRNIPKGVIELNGSSLIRRSIDKLFAVGIEKIVIGTGYLSELYDNFASKDPRIITVRSDRFESTSSMFTLYNMRNDVKEDFLLLESDLLYEQRALTALLQDKRKDVILASSWTESEDEVYIQCDAKGNLAALSKNPDDLEKLDSEFVGISKVSLERFDIMNQFFLKLDNPKMDYEHVFVQTAKIKDFPVMKMDDLLWCEVDNEQHLSRAINIVLPGIGG